MCGVIEPWHDFALQSIMNRLTSTQRQMTGLSSSVVGERWRILDMAYTFDGLIKTRTSEWWVCMGLLGTTAVLQAHAQDAIYRCGNTYTNNPTPTEKRDCKLIEGGNVTVISAPRMKPVVASSGTRMAAAPASVSTSSAEQPRVDPAQQRARDSDAKAILEAELKRAEARVIDLQREYNNGNPERKGDEARNHGKYVERTSELKASLLRAEADVIGIRRELQRLGVTLPPAVPSATPATNTSATSLPTLSVPVPPIASR